MATSEAGLMRECAPLYGSIALESFAACMMGTLFLYLYVRVSSKSEVKAPAKAMWRLLRYSAKKTLMSFSEAMRTWPCAPCWTVEERFTYCRKCNQGILLFQALMAFVSITRWLHIGNVNGFRYLGYSITCPPMQAELVLLVAPVVPHYRTVFIFTLSITFSMLILGWLASIRKEALFDCSFESLLDLDPACFTFTIKLWMIIPSMAIQMFLTFIHIPYLAILYIYNGGGSNVLLPSGYLKLLLIVAVTWLGFPIWWFLSYEGMGIIEDTRMNAIAFAVLNVVSKGAYSFQVLSMVGLTRARFATQGDTNAAAQLGANRARSGSLGSECSMSSCSDDGAPEEVRAALSLTAWLVRFLRNFDDGPHNHDFGEPPLDQETCTDPEAPKVQETPRIPWAHQPVNKTADQFDPSQAVNTIQQGKIITAIDTDRSAVSTPSTCATHNAVKEPEKTSTQLWEELEPMYRRFLCDAGVTPTCFSWMQAPERVNLREKFDKVASSCLAHTSSKMSRAYRRNPRWADGSAGPFGNATDDELMREVRRRMDGISHGPLLRLDGAAHEPIAIEFGSEDSSDIAESKPQKSVGLVVNAFNVSTQRAQVLI